MAKEIPTRAENYSEWYNELVKKADLAQHSAVKGCMVIKPYGYAIWEKMQAKLDTMFKETGHVNAYFPLLIPKSFLEKEEGHAEGFAKECAVVTHYRLKADPNNKGKLIIDPNSKLEEELIIRPTSETVIWSTYKDWIQSYRDLPLLINQWANVMRWEMRTRLFLRTAEFLWQEGHTAHSTSGEAVEETMRMLEVYAEFAETFLAIPVIKGVKPAHERFAGALDTYCIEAMMQDTKALQAGTSHYLGQNFAKAFDVTFLNKENQREFVYATSWGVSTRLMGALVMAHSDDDGLVLPPMVAPFQVVIVPLYKSDEERALTEKVCAEIAAELKKAGVRVKVDIDDTKRAGWKFAEYELKGVPLRIAVGPRDLATNQVELARRDTKEKSLISKDGLAEKIPHLLEQIQSNLFLKAATFRQENTHYADTYEEFKQILETRGGFIHAHWDGTTETADKIKNETKATIRCIPLDAKEEHGKCMVTGFPSSKRVVFAQAY
jgi:prolyl-tRNA synthetase